MFFHAACRAITRSRCSIMVAMACLAVPLSAETPAPICGIYVSGWLAGSNKMNTLLDQAAGTRINAVVVHVKDEWGNVHIPSTYPLVSALGMYTGAIRNLPAFVQKLHDRKFYLIAKIDCFKNKKLAEARPDLAVKSKATGEIWRDSKGLAWVDAFNSENWDLNIGVAMDLAKAGFDEIQFDYVRFPDGGVLGDCFYAANADTTNHHTRVWAIESFFKRAVKKLADYPVKVSADLFGMTCWRDLGGELGQALSPVGKIVDYVYPMIYPSHFPNDFYTTQKILYDDPYRVIYESCVRGNERLKEGKAGLRPWLQGFDYRVKGFDYKYVVTQIRAAEAAGCHEWCIWNAKCDYAETWKAMEQLKNEPPGQQAVPQESTQTGQ